MSGEQKLLKAFVTAHPEDVARGLERLSAAEVAAFLAGRPAEEAAFVLQRMVPSHAADCLAAVSHEYVGHLLAALPVDVAALLLRRLSLPLQERLLAATSPETASTLSFLRQFPEHTAGALMDPNVLSVPEDIVVREARARMRQSAHRVLYYLYVVDRSQKLVGVLNVRELLLAPGREPLTGVMQSNVARIPVHAHQQSIVTHPGWREFHALPVVDDQDHLVGAIRYKTLRNLEEEIRVSPPLQNPLVTVLTLGELYWVAIGGLAQALLSQGGAPVSPPQGGKADDSQFQARR